MIRGPEKLIISIVQDNDNNFVMISLISSLLLLGSASAERKIIFGRSVHKRPSHLKRIRSSQRETEETSPISKEVTTVEASRILLEEDGFRTEYMTNDKLSMPLSFEFSMFGGVPHLEGSSVSLSLDFSMLIIETPMNPTNSPSAWTDADAMSTEQSGAITVSDVDFPIGCPSVII